MNHTPKRHLQWQSCEAADVVFVWGHLLDAKGARRSATWVHRAGFSHFTHLARPAEQALGGQALGGCCRPGRCRPPAVNWRARGLASALHGICRISPTHEAPRCKQGDCLNAPAVAPEWEGEPPRPVGSSNEAGGRHMMGEGPVGNRCGGVGGQKGALASARQQQGKQPALGPCRRLRAGQSHWSD